MDLAAMQLNAPFCPCGAILDIADLRAKDGALKCPDCPLELSLEISKPVSVALPMDGAKLAAASGLATRNDEDLPTVEEDCPSCGGHTAYYRTMQLRSADEGQTIFYTCVACRYANSSA